MEQQLNQEIPLHSIARTVLDGIDQHSDVGDAISEAMRSRLVVTLEGIRPFPELNHAVLTLVTMARSFDESGDTAFADALIGVAATAAPRLEFLANPATFVDNTPSAQRARDFKAFTGNRVKQTAPTVGKPANTKGVSLATLSASRGVRLK